MAADIATNLTVGLMAPMYGQIDPMRLAEIERSLRISGDYGERLADSNLKPRALQRLLGDYPSHGFVIDREEAMDLFKTVSEPDADLKQIERLICLIINHSLTSGEPFVCFLSDEPGEDLEIVPNPQTRGAAGGARRRKKQNMRLAASS